MYVYRCIHGEVSWRLPLHGGFMLSFHHLVWKNRKHLKDENNIALLQFSEISDLVRRVCKTIEIQSEWIKNDRMTRYQEVVMILIGSMAFRVSNEDGSRKVCHFGARLAPTKSCELFFWVEASGSKTLCYIWYTIYIYYIYAIWYNDIYIPSYWQQTYTLTILKMISHDFPIHPHWWDVLICFGGKVLRVLQFWGCQRKPCHPKCHLPWK